MINEGVAFGLFPGISVYVIGVVIIGLVIVAVKMRELWGKIGILLMMIGGGSNLYSRVVNEGVVDNLNFFGLLNNNVWDYLIGLGIIFVIYGTYRARPRR